MQKLIIDSQMQSKLSDVRDRLQFCDEAGRVLGYFTPALDKSLYEGVDSPTSKEELRRRQADGGGRQLKEILADLEGQP